MDDSSPDFDAADLADSILGPDEANWVAVATLDNPVTPHQPAAPPPSRGSRLGWVLAAAAFVAVSVAISLAVQLDPTRPSPEPPDCGGLFATECCEDVGLFDEEERFSDDACR